MSNTQEHIRNHLLTTKSLPVSQSWLTTFLASISQQQQQRVPLSALTQTALFRVLASNFTESLSTSSTPSALLSIDVSNPAIKERRVSGPVPVQVLDIEDIGTSLWSQVEAIERVERGETLKGKEIIRTVNIGDDEDDNNSDNNVTTDADNSSGNNNSGPSGRNVNADLGMPGPSRGPHRLVLQDAAGTKAVAIELKPVEGIAIGKLPIGAKLLLRDAIIGRGMVLLTPESVAILGGKIEPMDAAWRKSRKESLVARLATMEPQAAAEG
jgi:RecQ-mediated genome instability protein 1